MKTFINITKAQFEKLSSYPDDVPVKMVNLLKFKDRVEDQSGEEAYHDYMKAVEPILRASNGTVLFLGKPQISLIGPSENEWDKVLIIEYPAKHDFLKMISREDYPVELRNKSLEDSRLILCTQCRLANSDS